MREAVRLDLNNERFQEQWFALEKSERVAVLQACIKIAKLSWSELYLDRGLHWELIHSRKGLDGSKLYSIRITQKMRAVVTRTGEYLAFLTLHADHDSAY